MTHGRFFLLIAVIALWECSDPKSGLDMDGALPDMHMDAGDGPPRPDGGADLAQDIPPAMDQIPLVDLIPPADQFKAPFDQNSHLDHFLPDLKQLSDAGCGSGSSWALSAGGAGLDFAQHMAVDTGGNSFITGYFAGTATFGSFKLTSAGANDVFVAKISPAGKIIWAVSAGGNGADAGTGIAVDAKGNSYITGSFNGSAKFGAVTLKTLGTNDIFVAKLDGNGQFLWALFTQGTTKDMVSRIAVDGAGQAYITGYISGKVAASGASFVWIKYTDGVASSIALDSAGNSYIAGYFSGKVQFGSTNFTAVSSGDAFVARINAKGTVDMAVQAQGQSGGFASASAIDINKAGQLALAGGYHGTYAFGGTKLTSPGPGKKEDLFVARLNTKGTFQWAVSAGGSEQDSASSVAIDPAGGVHVAGSFAGSAKFGSTSLQATGSAGKSDVFSAQLSPTGAFLRAIRAGGNDMDSAAALGLDAAGYAYLLGVYQGSAGFGPSSLSSKGGFDVFLARLDLCGKF